MVADWREAEISARSHALWTAREIGLHFLPDKRDDLIQLFQTLTAMVIVGRIEFGG